jgi:hypothetical protein
VLLDKWADREAVTLLGQTPLALARRWGQLGAITVISEYTEPPFDDAEEEEDKAAAEEIDELTG